MLEKRRRVEMQKKWKKHGEKLWKALETGDIEVKKVIKTQKNM